MAIDFLGDRIESGRSIRLLNIADAFTRERRPLQVDTSFASRRVTGVLDSAIRERGAPGRIRATTAGADQQTLHRMVY
jgi:transposase InsO family protein